MQAATMKIHHAPNATKSRYETKVMKQDLCPITPTHANIVDEPNWHWEIASIEVIRWICELRSASHQLCKNLRRCRASERCDGQLTPGRIANNKNQTMLEWNQKETIIIQSETIRCYMSYLCITI